MRTSIHTRPGECWRCGCTRWPIHAPTARSSTCWITSAPPSSPTQAPTYASPILSAPPPETTTRCQPSFLRDQEFWSYDFWRHRFGADPNLIGKNITVNLRSRTVVGVMPARFNFPIILPGRASEQMALWLPLSTDPREEPRGVNRYVLVGRLKPGISIEQAQQNMDHISARLAEQYPDT